MLVLQNPRLFLQLSVSLQGHQMETILLLLVILGVFSDGQAKRIPLSDRQGLTLLRLAPGFALVCRGYLYCFFATGKKGSF